MKITQINLNLSESVRVLSPLMQIKEGRWYRCEYCVKSESDGFSAPEEQARPACLWVGRLDAKNPEWGVVLSQLSCSDTFVRLLKCGVFKEGPASGRPYVVAEPFEFGFQKTSRPENETEMVSILCEGVRELWNKGWRVLTLCEENLVLCGAHWKWLPTSPMEKRCSGFGAEEENPDFSTLGRFLQSCSGWKLWSSEPARTLLTSMIKKTLDIEQIESIRYPDFWDPIPVQNSSLQVRAEHKGADWSVVWTDGWDRSFHLLQLNETVNPKTLGSLCWESEQEALGRDFLNNSAFRPSIDSRTGRVAWSVADCENPYEKFWLLPYVSQEKWLALGTPICVGGPEEVKISERSSFDQRNNELVLDLIWPSDPLITLVYVVVRSDRFAKTPNDFSEREPFIVARQPILSPFRISNMLDEDVFVSIFSRVLSDENIVSNGYYKHFATNKGENKCLWYFPGKK